MYKLESIPSFLSLKENSIEGSFRGSASHIIILVGGNFMRILSGADIGHRTGF